MTLHRQKQHRGRKTGAGCENASGPCCTLKRTGNVMQTVSAPLLFCGKGAANSAGRFTAPAMARSGNAAMNVAVKWKSFSFPPFSCKKKKTAGWQSLRQSAPRFLHSGYIYEEN